MRNSYATSRIDAPCERLGESPERPFLGEQLRLRPALRDPPLLENEDLVRPPHGGEPVGDDHRRPAAQQRVERLLDQDLAGAVDVRRRLVEDQDAWIGEQRARDRDQLPLAGREPDAALADDVVETAVEPRRDPVDADRVRRRGDLLVGGLGLARSGCCRRSCR